MFGLLRVIRGFFGFIAAWQVFTLLPILSWVQNLGAVNGKMMAILVMKLLIMGISFGAFFGLRLLINKLYIKRHGIKHPALVKKWTL